MDIPQDQRRVAPQTSMCLHQLILQMPRVLACSPPAAAGLSLLLLETLPSRRHQSTSARRSPQANSQQPQQTHSSTSLSRQSSWWCTPSNSPLRAMHQQPHQLAHRALHLAPPFLVEHYTPVAVTTHALGRMPAKLAAAEAELADCNACPRNCSVNRQGSISRVCCRCG